MTMNSFAGRRTSSAPRARAVVFALVAANVGWLVGLPLALTEPPTGTSRLLLGGLLALLGSAYVSIVWAAVTPSVGRPTINRLVALLLLAAIGLWPLTYRWAEPGQEPWAWLAGVTVGAVALVLRWPATGATGVVAVAAATAGALLFGASVVQNVGFLVGAALVMLAMGRVMVWLLQLLSAVEGGREAEAGLAVLHERLRLAQELHDVLGHRLSVIALKAEVTGASAHLDADRVQAEADQIRSLATSTLRDVRQVVHGYGTVDLAEQLDTTRLVFASAGITAEITAGPAVLQRLDLDLPTSQLFAVVIREAVTNILRHSDAQQVSLDLAVRDGVVALVLLNDRPRPPGDPGATIAVGSGTTGHGMAGMGLSGLAERCADAGARLRYGLVGEHFEVRLELVPG